jgi:transposase
MNKKERLLQKLNGLVRKASVPRWLHHFGPKKFTTWQHLKCVFLKQKLKCSWRDLMELLPYFGMKQPHFTTLIKFAARMPQRLWNLLLSWSAQADHCSIGAIDATGLGRTSASYYYVKRIDGHKNQQHVKLSIFVDVERRIILSARLRAKPTHDVKDVAYLTSQSPVLPEVNLMDKGYDSNAVHAHFREQGVFSIIPARKGCRKGQYRKEMRDFFDYGQYWQRNIVETVISCIKRKFGSVVRSRNIKTQRSEVYARLILHNLSLAIARLFHQSPHLSHKLS